MPRRGLGTGDPQCEQKSDRNPVSFVQEEMNSDPLSQRNFSAEMIVAALDKDPDCLRQSEQ
jgi:hypothetical protein